MADVSAIFGILIIFGLAFPGLLMAWWLLFPATVARAGLRLDKTPGQCFGLGLLLTVVLAVPLVILLALPFGPAKFLGWMGIAVALTVSSLGAAGIVAKMGERLAQKSTVSPAVAFLQAAFALEMAVFFPLLGWLLVFPLVVITALGATAFALLRWMPRVAPVPAATPGEAAASNVEALGVQA
jgi:hypothetical protein